MANYRDDSNKFKLSPSTQKTANWLSSYMRGRQYKFSIWQQLINAIALQVDQMNEALSRQHDNRFPATFRADTIDVVYTADIPSSIGTITSGGIEISPSKYSNYEDWWYSTVPTRVSPLRQYADNQILDAVTPSKAIPIDELVDENSGWYITLTSDNGSFINDKLGELQYGTQVIIHGYDKFGTKKREDFTFYYPTYYRSSVKWKRITEIETVLNDDPDKFKLSFGTSIGHHLPFIEDKTLRYVDNKSVQRPLFWTWEPEEKTLAHYEFSAQTVSDFHAGIRDIDKISEYKLMAYNGSDFSPLESIDDLIPSEDGNLIYVLSNGELLAYHKLNDYPQIVQEASKLRTPDPLIKIDASLSGTKVLINPYLNREQLNKNVDSFRFILKRGEESKQLVNVSVKNESNNQWVNQDESKWEVYDGEGKFGLLPMNIFYDDSQYHLDDIMIILEVKLQNGDIERDTFVIEKQVKYPVFQYGINPGNKLGFSADGFLAVSNMTKYQEYKFNNDTYIVTDDKLIFSENYTDLKNDGSPISISAFNVNNELDEWASINSFDRKTGEKSYEFKDRLEFSFNNRFDSSTEGLTNAISAELGLMPKNVAFYESSSPISIIVANSSRYFGPGNPDKFTSLLETATLGELLEEMKNQGINITTLDSSLNDLPAGAIMNTDNRIYYDGYIHENKTKIILNIPEDEMLVESEVTIDDFEKVSSTSLFNDGEKQFTIIDGSYIVTNHPLGIDNLLSYMTVKTKGFIKASPVIVTPINDMETVSFSYGHIHQATQTVIKDAENNHPNKWSA